MSRRRSKRMKQLNLTSMLDVCFLLLIFFVLTASFDLGEGILPTELPHDGLSANANPTTPPPMPLNIALRSLGGDDVSIQVSGMTAAPADFHELYAVLADHRYDPATNPTAPYMEEDPITITPDRTVRWAHVVNAFNAARRARYANVQFAQAR
ncbi:biopolymer transporter ExbD [Planctomycetales bacterium ZRK34]|nr:biopolymer transporter ExbD [Planctomycetales bacterium ZRK34]